MFEDPLRSSDGSRQPPSAADVELLWAGASHRPDLVRVADAASDADLTRVLQVAEGQRIAPLVLRSLSLAGVEVPRSASSAVRHQRGWEAHARLALPAAAALALEPLDRAALRPIALKGLALAERYPAPGLRPMDDIDVLLPKELVEYAVDVLERAGWRLAGHPHRDPGYDHVLIHPKAPGVPLELHHELARWGERARGLETADVWRTRKVATLFGRRAWILPPEAEILALVVHAAKPFHNFNRLLWFVDVAIVAGTPGLDWTKLADLAAAARRRIALGVALTAAQRLGASIPPELLEIPPVETPKGVLDSLLDPARPFRAADRSRSLAYVLVDNVPEKLRLAATDVLRPMGGTPRLRIAADIAAMVARGAPSYIRSRRRSRAR